MSGRGVIGCRSLPDHDNCSANATEPPSVPQDLVWYPRNHYAALASARIDGAMNEFTLEMCYDNDFGINADLVATADRHHIDTGGRFQHHLRTVWNISGKLRVEESVPAHAVSCRGGAGSGIRGSR
jgi:hypothetical protein